MWPYRCYRQNVCYLFMYKNKLVPRLLLWQDLVWFTRHYYQNRSRRKRFQVMSFAGMVLSLRGYFYFCKYWAAEPCRNTFLCFILKINVCKFEFNQSLREIIDDLRVTRNLKKWPNHGDDQIMANPLYIQKYRRTHTYLHRLREMESTARRLILRMLTLNEIFLKEWWSSWVCLQVYDSLC